ncbi:MAG: twin-arginine translocation signal domain-containing protein, partial [Opitutae bacterium]
MNLPESIIRRDFIKQLGVASAAALATEGTKAWANEAVKHPEAKA